MSFLKTMAACSLSLTFFTIVRISGGDSNMSRADRQTNEVKAFVDGLKAQKKPFAFVRLRRAQTCYAIGYDASMLNRGGALPFYLPPEKYAELEKRGVKIEEIDESPIAK